MARFPALLPVLPLLWLVQHVPMDRAEGATEAAPATGGAEAARAAGVWHGEGDEGCEATSLLQVDALAQPPRQRGAAHESLPRSAAQLELRSLSGEDAERARGSRDLVLQHIPYNFGHTVEKVAALGSGPKAQSKYMALAAASLLPEQAAWNMLKKSMRPGGEVWGHMNPALGVVSNVTHCPLYFTPGKFWPRGIAETYFGDKTVFGMLRDPYERLVAMFRGNMGEYGGSYPEFIKTCDVNGAVKSMMTNYLAGDIYAGDCTFLPQAEYFDMPFGITLAVNNRRFPDSMNDVLAAHNYTDLHIETGDILHVTQCSNIWAGDLDCETKALVKKVYKRDFDLLCSNFGYCDVEENCCIEGVPMMCPAKLEEKRRTGTRCA